MAKKRTKVVASPAGPQTLVLPPAADEALLLKVAEEALHGERDVFEGLSPVEREIVVQWLAESLVTANPDNPVHDVLWELDFHRKPVSIETFLHDPEYMGKVASGLEEEGVAGTGGRAQGLHPRWEADLKEVFRPGSPYTEFVMTGAIGTGKCLREDQLVHTAEGLVPIRELYGRHGRVQAESGLRPITRTHDEGETRTCLVRTAHGHELEGRPNHRIRVLGADLTWAWRRLDALRPGDCVLQVPADTFGPQDVPDAVAELLGWYVAEGVWYARNAEARLCLHPNEMNYVETLARKASEDALCCRVSRSDVGRYVRLAGGNLEAYFVSGTSHYKEVPPVILRGTRRAVCRFLRGLFSGDGYAGPYGCELTTMSKVLAEQVRALLTALGLTCSVTTGTASYRKAGVRHVTGTKYTVRIVGPDALRAFATEIGFVHPEKQRRLLRFAARWNRNTDHSFSFRLSRGQLRVLRTLQPRFHRGSVPDGLGKTTTPRGLIRRLARQGCTVRLLREIQAAGGRLPSALAALAGGRVLFDTVASVVPSRAHCYDLTVADDPSYVAGGFVHHNTTTAMLALAFKLYWLSCLRDPQRYYGLLTDSLMVFGIYSITKRQVADTGYYKLRGWLDSSPYFRAHFPRSKKIDSKIVFTRQSVQVVPGCVAEGTLVATPEGWVPIERLPREGGEVWSAGDTVSRVRYSRVVDAGVKRCLTLERADGKMVTVSHAHRIEVLRDGARTFVEARDIRPGEAVLGLPHVEAGDGVLSSEREAAAPVQGVHEAAAQRLLPRDQDLRGQDQSPGGSAEAVPEVSGDAAARGVPHEDAPASWRDEDVLAFLVQGLRVDGCQALVPGEHGSEEGVRPEAPFHIGLETTREEALAAVLRGEPHHDLGAYVVARRPFQAEPEAAGVAAVASRQVARVPAGVAEAVPLERTLDRAVTAHSETGVAGHAYAVGHRTGAGILWRKVLLLWARPLPANLDLGPCGSVESGRWYDAEEYGARVQGVQQQQARPDGRGILPDALARTSLGSEGDGGLAAAPALSVVRVVAVRDAGYRRCYDVVEAGPHRAFFAGGLLVRNSRELHALGLDLYSFAIDEMNFMQARADRDQGRTVGQAYDLYNSTHARITSRFLRPGGTIPGIMLLMSSKNAQTSFLEELLKQRREAGLAHTYVSDYALWDVKPAHRFILPKFRVEVGDRVAKSRLLSDTNLTALRQHNGGKLSLAETCKRGVPPAEVKGEAPRAGATVVEVPGEYLRTFDEDVDQALREAAGVATFNVSPLIRDRVSITDAIRADIPNPFTREEVTLNVEDNVLLEDHFKIDVAARIVDGAWIPRLNPTLPRFVHVDLGLTGDAAGLAMGHISGVKQVERLNPDGTRSAIESPFIIIDLMLRILPPAGSEIDFAKIRAFLGYLKRAYPIVKVTLDGWQSVDFVQIVRKPPLRFEADIQSIDRTDGPYVSLRSAHFDRRIAMYAYQPYIDEVLDLQRVKRANSEQWKVDHPEKATKGGKGRKDVSDCVAGVVAGLLEDARFGRGVPVVDPDTHAGISASARVVDPAKAVTRPSRTRRVAGRDVDLDALRRNLQPDGPERR